MASTDKTCISEGCDKPATLQCPTCIKLKIGGSFFCSQDCFKKNWGQHKLVHKAKIESEPHDPFPNYRYTGELRAVYPLSPRREVPEGIMRPDYAETSIPISEQNVRSSSTIKILNAEEIEGMRKVCKICREVLDAGAAAIRPGITPDEIDEIIHKATIERGAYPSPLNYYKFPKSVCISVNEVICHGIPDKRPLKDGDIVNLDISCYYNGFHGDMNATYCVGNVDAKGKQLINTARECLEKAIAMVKPGVRYRDFGKVIEDHAKKNGFSVNRTFSGHGINQLFHCAPNVPHYSNNKAIGIIKPGHCFTIEPMICEGGWRDEIWPDNWTAVTSDGKRSAQFEHTLLVTENGCEILTK
ncbi:methionine aminopeptidase 1-like protein [Gilbertella persicaria]|uniref:Methionine aminopeptidase n=1 Tax=Rhizopus stolonifer TaxID=4846 RepID=A0A367INS8_RHIST|nr:methionine aminopeptidase 1-like protein [Gilbertella persicaria]KAI8083367.1 methionine aminopeptidase 1-like protein [Gilbertella persicaria]RCH79337.1 Methionine aminopeptidase 1 [Rhizopus stolonifer]